MSGSHSGSDDSNDSRKRPPEQELDPNSSPKRQNCGEYHNFLNGQLNSKDENVQLKVLVPSIAAGAVIGKSGEAIGRIQKETNTKVKISKQDEFYPGTTERVCLIVGSLEGVMAVHNYIMDRIMEKPDPNPHACGEGRLNVERHKQVKILVPNSTAGMVIGKGGTSIQDIKDKTGAYVQISQKSQEYNLPERCIVIAGELHQTRAVIRLILTVIAADPQSASCPNLSYNDVQGPVASVYPTGSPYATPVVPGLANRTNLSNTSIGSIDPATAAAATMMAALSSNPVAQVGTYPGSRSATFGFFSSNYSPTPDLTTLAALATNPATSSFFLPPMLPPSVFPTPAGVGASVDLVHQQPTRFPWASTSHQTNFNNSLRDPQQTTLLTSFRPKLPESSSLRPNISPPLFVPQSALLPTSLRISSAPLLGYPSTAIGSIGRTGSPSQHSYASTRAVTPFGETHPSIVSSACTMPSTSTPSMAANVAFAALSAAAAAAAASATPCTKPTHALSSSGSVLGVLSSGPSFPNLSLSQIVPQGLPGDTLSLSLTNIQSPSSLFLTMPETPSCSSSGGSCAPAIGGTSGHAISSAPVSAAASAQSSNLAPSMLGLYALQSPTSTLPTSPVIPVGAYLTCRRIIAVPESMIGVVLGPQGRSIMDLQSTTGTIIQISQKGVYLHGTQDRAVTITGAQSNVEWAAQMIEQSIAREQLRRETSSTQQQQQSQYSSSSVALAEPDYQQRSSAALSNPSPSRTLSDSQAIHRHHQASPRTATTQSSTVSTDVTTSKSHTRTSNE